jgi:hypothetical protein
MRSYLEKNVWYHFLGGRRKRGESFIRDRSTGLRSEGVRGTEVMRGVREMWGRRRGSENI